MSSIETVLQYGHRNFGTKRPQCLYNIQARFIIRNYMCREYNKCELL